MQSPFKSLNPKASLTLALGLLLSACGGGGGGEAPGPNTGTVSGSVLNAPNPVSGVELTISGPGGTFTTTTSNTGTYRIENVPAGAYTVQVSGQGVFDSTGTPIPDKIDLFLPSVTINSGNNTIGDKPIFLPEKAIGTEVDTGGLAVGSIPAGTVITNPTAGVSLVFEELTTVTFQDAQDTSISILRVPIGQTPVPLPADVTASSVFAVLPAGATFDVRPKVIFSNDTGLAGGTDSVPLYRLDYTSGEWTQYGTGSVAANGDVILSDAGQGMDATGWQGPVVSTLCTTNVTGRVEDTSGMGVSDVLVSTINGASATTDASGNFSIADVPLPSATFQVIATAVPAANSGFLAAESNGTFGACGSETNVGTLVLSAVLVDMTAPMIASSSPADGDTDVDDSVSVSVTFNEVMSPGSLNSDTLALTSGADSISSSIGISESGGETTVTLVPTSPLAVDSTFSLRVGADVMDGSGNPLGSETLISFTTAASGSGGTPSVDVLPDAPAGIDPGATLQFTADVLDGDSTSVNGAQVVWTSDAPAVASVDSTGLVTALSPGVATIQGAFGDQTDEVSLTINTPVVASVSLNTTSEALVTGSSITIEASALDSNLAPLAGFTFDWSSDTTGVATVDAGGNVLAVGAGGPAVITATEPGSGESASVAIVVIDPTMVNAVVVQSGGGALGAGESQQFSADAYSSSQDLIPGVGFTWSSSSDAVATVNANGLVTAVSDGMANITATATDSGGVMGTVGVTVYNETPLVVTFQGGPLGTQPEPGVEIFRHDAMTGEFIESLTTDQDGRADFGSIGSTRTTLTIFFGQLESGSEIEFVTLHNIPVGTVPFVRRPFFQQQQFGVDVSYTDKGNDEAFVFSGGYSDGDTYFSSQAGLSHYVGGVQVIETEADGTSSYIVTTGDAFTREMRGAAFLLDIDPQANGLGYNVDSSSDNVASVPFTADIAVMPAAGTIRRRSHLYEPFHGGLEASTSGTTEMPIMPGADRVSLSFDATASSGTTRLTTESIYQALPASVAVVMPELLVAEPSFDLASATLSVGVEGPSAAGLDLGGLEFEYSSEFGPVSWSIFFDPSVTSMTLPGLPQGMADFLPSSSEIPMELTYAGLDVVTGFDALLQVLRQYRGSLEHLKMDAGNQVYGAQFSVDFLTFEIDGDGGGTVTLDMGDGPVSVTDGELVAVPIGTTVTVAAEADGNSFLEGFQTPECIPFAGGGSASCTFVMGGGETILVDFTLGV